MIRKITGSDSSDADNPRDEPDILTSVIPQKLRADLAETGLSPDTIRFEELPPDTELTIEIEAGGKQILIIDPANLSEETWEAIKSDLLEEARTWGGATVESATPFVASFKDTEAREHMDQLCSFYESKVPPRFLKMIRESLLLRYTVERHNLSLEEVRQRKREISKYGDEAFAVSSLCSAGYFDEDRFFWKLYEEQVENGEWSVSDYGERFQRITAAKPFVVFVKVEDQANDVYDRVLAKAVQLPRYEVDIDFLDIRGRGEKNMETVRNTLELLREHHHDLVAESPVEVGHELVVRIDPDSI